MNTGKNSVDVKVESPSKANPVVEVPQMEKSEEPKTVENSWYYDDEEVVEVIEGIEVHIKLVSGEEFTRIADMCMPPVTDIKVLPQMDKCKYMRLLIKKCVIKPEFTYSKLKPSVITALVSRLEELAGLSEMAQKNLDTR